MMSESRPMVAATGFAEPVDAELVDAELVENRDAFFRDQRSKYQQLARLMQSSTPITWAVIAVIAVVYIWMLWVDHGIAAGNDASWSIDPRWSVYLGANWRSIVLAESQWWRLLTSVFLHGSLIHILFNAYAMYVLAPTFERLFGGGRLFILIVVAGLAGSAASLMTNGSPSVGLSGSVFGIVGGLWAMTRKFKDHVPVDFAAQLRRGMIQVVIINLVLGFTIARIDNAAHIGGLIGGGAVTLLMNARLNQQRGQEQRANLAAILLVIVSASALWMMARETTRCAASDPDMAVCYGKYIAAIEE